MRASLDTNVVIHFYQAKLQNILFEFFEDGVFIYEQIRLDYEIMPFTFADILISRYLLGGVNV